MTQRVLRLTMMASLALGRVEALHGTLNFISDTEIATMTTDEEELDLRGYQCPLPVLKTRNALRKKSSGEQLWIITDDPLAGLDIPNFCNEYDQELLAQEKGEAECDRFLIQRSDAKL